MASYVGYITQAIINNLIPLLLIVFQAQYGISIGQMTFLLSLNFGIQLCVDLAAISFVDTIGYRMTVVLAHAFAAAGLLCLGILPRTLPHAYTGLLIAVCINAIGGGLIEVIISPIVEALPGDSKAASMSLLHSFYCWGCVLVIVVSTLYLRFIGRVHWMYLPMIWALLPLVNAFIFAKTPIKMLVEHAHERISLKALFSSRTFGLLFLVMICSGASEQAMSQWASLFAEAGLNVSKTFGDLLGPCVFAILMGTSRLLLGLRRSYPIERSLTLCAVGCVGSYLIAVFVPIPVLALLGCGLCGLFVGVMWPGTFSLASKQFPKGGTAMFAILALAGDIGCSAGPGLVGSLSGAVANGFFPWVANLFSAQSIQQVGLKFGLLCAVIFPLVMILCITYLKRRKHAK
jgi:Fucose permease